MKLRGAIFDLDGTVVEVPYDWARIKSEIGSGSVPILTYLNSLSEPERSRKWTILQRYEDDATARAVLKRGMRRFLDYLKAHSIRTALVTNNSQKNVSALLDRFRLTFDCVLSRDAGLWKPSGEPLRTAMTVLELSADECCAIGDSHFDVHAAQDAGIARIFILSKDRGKFTSWPVEIFGTVAALQKRIAELV